MIDTGELHVAAGRGGDGALSFRREKYVARGGPEGGDGGRGGSVVLVAAAGETTLRRYQRQRHFRAENGGAGAKSNRHGRDGADVRLPVPVGTVATVAYVDGRPGWAADLVAAGQEVVVAQGGAGGRGNAQFVSPVNQEPLLREAGEGGDVCTVGLEVKLIADIGVIGAPNAGKSSLIGRVTAAQPRVAAYPFTTLEPQLGVVEIRGQPVVIAEIPGLVEGAHRGVGLGHDFLRHAERTRLFLHLLDGAGEDPAGAYAQVNEELAQYSDDLAARPQVVALNKADMAEAQEQRDAVCAALRAQGVATAVISAATGQGVAALLDRLLQELQAAPATGDDDGVTAPVPPRHRPRRRGGTVAREGDVFVVRWPGAERLTALANVDDHRVVGQLLREFRRLGVTAALEAAGVAQGDAVQVGRWAWAWGEALAALD